MSRPLAFLVAALTLVGCSGAAEQPILQQFFAASRLHDTTALAGFATASFDPSTDGIVTTFTITHVVTTDDGTIVSKRVSLSAPVALPNGRSAQKDYVATMQRQRTAPEPGEARGGRWVITSITDASGSPSTPRP